MFLLILLVAVVAWQLPDRKLHVVFCDVGQGDAILVSFKSYQMLVDGGSDDSVLSCLGKSMPFWDRTIEVVVLTHPQVDHMTGLIEVFERYRVERLVANSVGNNTAEFRAFYEVVKQEQIEIVSLVQGDALSLGPVELEVVWPKESAGLLAWNKPDEAQVLGAKYPGDLNDTSVVMRGRYGKFNFLLTGDIGERVERLLVDKLNEMELLKVAHHGSRYSSDEAFLKAVRPKLAVISVGKKNRFGHPTEAVLERLSQVGARVIRTDELGLVEVVSDGESFWVK